MSIHRIQRISKRTGKPSVKWEVHWREHGRQRTRSFDRKGDAEQWEAEVKRRKQLGTLHTLNSSRTLGTFVAETWSPERTADLASATRRTYANLWSAHLEDTFNDVPLREITAPLVAQWRTERERAGAGTKALREAHSLLGGILAYACELGELEYNAARAVRPKRRAHSEPVRAWSPYEVERLRVAIASATPTIVAGSKPGQRARKSYTIERLPQAVRERDLALVSVLAYSGLRPAEALALRWDDVHDKTLLVSRACDLTGGAIKSTKTGPSRVVRFLTPLAADLKSWQKTCPKSTERWIFPPADGNPWRKSDWDNWRNRHWLPGLKIAKLPHSRPYDLRHTFASLLLAEGHTIHYVASQLGHGAEQTLRTYGHLIDMYEGKPKIDAAKEIRAARKAHPLRPADADAA
ncbi:MAG: tyrosine-type recombinase/integrase [Baekduiaceae bacterium]